MTTVTALPARVAWLSARLPAVLVVSLLLGGATSWAQFLLPDQIVAVANSASGWTLITVLLVFAARLPAAPSAVAGAGSFILLTIGYAVVSTWRGFFYDPTYFVVIGAVVGPFVGAASALIRGRGVLAGLSTALLSGIAVGEALYGVTVVGDTTSPVYWVLIGATGVALLALMLVERLRGALPRVVAAAGTALVAVLFLLAYTAAGSL